MARRSRQSDPESISQELLSLLENFRRELGRDDLRQRVLALVPVARSVRDLGSSLIPKEEAASAIDRIILYLRKYPGTVVTGEELMVVGGISEWARRVRQLRVELGWKIVSGQTAKAMAAEGDFSLLNIEVSKLKTDHYILVDTEQDRDAAYRWRLANTIRKSKVAVRDKLLDYLRANVGKSVLGEELMYVADGATEWARRVRELRTENGWPVATRTSGRPDLPVGVYVLEEDRQSPAHDRHIEDKVRGAVLVRDEYRCQCCGWNHTIWNRSDPRHLELHHIEEHVKGGSNDEDNLVTLCKVCHDHLHATGLSWLDYQRTNCA